MSEIKNSSHHTALAVFAIMAFMPWYIGGPYNPGGFRTNFLVIGFQLTMSVIGMTGLGVTLYRQYRRGEENRGA